MKLHIKGNQHTSTLNEWFLNERSLIEKSALQGFFECRLDILSEMASIIFEQV